MSRLPQIDGDDGTWGGILNDFILQERRADGSLKKVNYFSAAGKTTLSDSDFTSTPPNGALATVRNSSDDTTRFFMRSNDFWDEVNAGMTGPQGPAGQGVPIGGTTDQVLAKISDTDYDTQWNDPGIAFNIDNTGGSLYIQPNNQVGGFHGGWNFILDDISDGTDPYNNGMAFLENGDGGIFFHNTGNGGIVQSRPDPYGFLMVNDGDGIVEFRTTGDGGMYWLNHGDGPSVFEHSGDGGTQIFDTTAGVQIGSSGYDADGASVRIGIEPSGGDDGFGSFVVARLNGGLGDLGDPLFQINSVDAGANWLYTLQELPTSDPSSAGAMWSDSGNVVLSGFTGGGGGGGGGLTPVNVNDGNSPFDLANGQLAVVDASAGDVVINIPDSPAGGDSVGVFLSTDTNGDFSVTVNSGGNSMVGNNPLLMLTQYQTMVLVFDGADTWLPTGGIPLGWSQFDSPANIDMSTGSIQGTDGGGIGWGIQGSTLSFEDDNSGARVDIYSGGISSAPDGQDAFMASGANGAIVALEAGGMPIINLADGTDPQDAATVAQIAAASFPAWFQFGNGAPVGAVTPNTTQGQPLYMDLSQGALYSATGLTDADWVAIGGNTGVSTPGVITYAGGGPFLFAAPSQSVGISDTASWPNGTQNGLLWNAGASDGSQTLNLTTGSSGQFHHTWAANGNYSLPKSAGFFGVTPPDQPFLDPLTATTADIVNVLLIYGLVNDSVL